MALRIMMWLVLIFAAWWFLRPRPKPRPPAPGAATASARSGAPRPAAPPPALQAEAMVDCVRCGLHFPASEALRDDAGRVYCSGEHLRAGPRAAG